MSYVPQYPPDTLYSRTPIIGRFLDFYVPVLIPADPSDSIFIIKRLDWVQRPDLIALDYYGDELLFWVFGVRNGLSDIVYDIQYGTALFFPTPTRLTQLGIGGSLGGLTG